MGELQLQAVVMITAVILWNVTNGLELKTFNGHTDWVKCVAFSPDGQILASASMDGSVKLWSLSSDSGSSTVKPGDWVESVTFSPDGQTLATSGNMNGSIELWDVSKIYPNRIEPIVGHRSGVSSITFHPMVSCSHRQAMMTPSDCGM